MLSTHKIMNTPKVKWSHDGLQWLWTVRSWSNFDDDGARSVPYLQRVSAVQSPACQILTSELRMLLSAADLPLILCGL